MILRRLLTAGLGLVGALLLAMTALASARGPFYLLVEPGPYDDAWGGPSPLGAWAAHTAVWAATLPVAALLLAGLAGLHARVAERLTGDGRSAWAPPAAAVVVLAGAVLAGAVLLRAWLHQL